MKRLRNQAIARARAALATVVACAALGACRATAPVARPESASAGTLVDHDATPETRALFANLRRLAGRQVMFGHQDDLAYGTSWFATPGRSDVKESAGAYPAVYGWDAGGTEHAAAHNIDGVDFAAMRSWIAEGYGRGGVITVSWHMDNPVSGGNAWDTTGAVAAVLPGGARHAEYTAWLDRFATFAHALHGVNRAGRDTPVPIVFRPFHEMTGGWFWWGAGHATPEQYRALWRFTVEYLRDRRGVHNVLYAYSPASSAELTTDRYWERYPGDAYVDVIGFDEYLPAPTPGDTVDHAAVLGRHLSWLARQADARGKVAALTETGSEGVPDSTWWTGTVLRALETDASSRRVAWALVWRNARRDAAHPRHNYAPFRGHPSVADFVRFRASPLVAFEDELPDMYRWP